MKLSDFKYKVNESLIAQYPLKERDKAKLLVLNREDESLKEGKFRDILSYLNKGDCLVVNETKVFPARLLGVKEKTEAQVEIFLLRELERNLWEVLVKPARKVRIGNRLVLNGKINCDVIDNTVSGGRVIRFNYKGNFYSVMERIGYSPLPPYIKRPSEPSDKKNYQTVFARVKGSVAAPTAGLHFTKDLIKKIKQKGVKIVPIVLHIGLGTFRQVQVEDLTRHRMDSEYFEVSPESVSIINKTKKEGGKIICVGTSSVRALESVITSDNFVKPYKGWTDKFIFPPYEFKVADKLITNFHIPCSTLLMLVCAFANRDFVFKAYRKALKEKYRFYSYGDAMMIV